MKRPVLVTHLLKCVKLHGTKGIGGTGKIKAVELFSIAVGSIMGHLDSLVERG